MAEQVSIPAGVNPANIGGGGSGGGDVTHYGTRANGGGAPNNEPGNIPALPNGNEQKPGFVPEQKPTPPAGVDAAEYAAFLAFKAAQGKPAPTEPKPEPKPALPTKAEPVGPHAAMEAAMQAGATDPVLSSTFEMIALVAPDVDLSRAMGNAIDRGDLDLIDRAYLKEVGGDKADRLIKLAENMVKHIETQSEAIIADTYKAAGSEAQWNAATAAFNASAPEYLRQYVVEAMNSANPTKIRVGVAAVLEYVKQTGALPTAPQGHVRAGGGLPSEQTGLSKAEYQAERLKLNRFDRDYNDRARELDARRAIGKKAGK